MAANFIAHSNLVHSLISQSASPFIFINGPADSGKTTLLQSLAGSSALYIDSLECITMSVLYERVLNFVEAYFQISKPRAKSISSFKPCSTISEMVTRLSSNSWPAARKIVLLIDEAERLFQLDSNSFSVLLRLPEMFNHQICLVLASREQFNDFGSSATGGLVPIEVSFSALNEEESSKILLEMVSNDLKLTNNSSFKPCEIVSAINSVKKVSDGSKKNLLSLKNLVLAALLKMNNQPFNASKLPKLVKEHIDESLRLDIFYHQAIGSLCLIEKYILISAFIASFQTYREDLKIFGAFTKQRKALKKDDNSDKLTVQLPKLFDQTRLIAIFYFLVNGLAILPSPQQIQLNIRSLCDRGFLKFSGNPYTKIDSLKYRVNFSKDFANLIAKEFDLSLKDLSIKSQ